MCNVMVICPSGPHGHNNSSWILANARTQADWLQNNLIGTVLACTCAVSWSHDDVIKWKHFPRYWPFVWGIHRSPVNSPHKGQWRGALMFSLICVWINGWVNNREAGDLRCYQAHYDVTVMICPPGPHGHVHRHKKCFSNLVHRAGDPPLICLSWIQMFAFRMKFHLNMFLGALLTIRQKAFVGHNKLKYANTLLSFICFVVVFFLPEASFGLRVLSLPACVCVSVCLFVRQSWACPSDNSSTVQARITKFGPEKQNTLVKIPVVFWGNWPWPSRSNLTSNSKLTPFWACPNHYSPPILVRISKLGQEMHFSTVKIPVNSGLDWPWTSPSFLSPKLFFFALWRCALRLVCFNSVQGLFHSLYTSAHGEHTAKVEWGL